MMQRGHAIAMGLLMTCAFAAGWLANGWRGEARTAQMLAAQSIETAALAGQAQAASERNAQLLLAHGAVQQENTHDYTQEMARLEAGRAADAARIAGLQHDIRAAATRNAQLAGDAAACRDLADQHARLAALAGEGAGVVGQLVALVERRDAQLSALKGQVQLDRQLLESQ